MDKKYDFSLILCTLGRNEFVSNFLKTINVDSNISFEIILIDQNIDNQLEDIIKQYSSLNIKYLKSDKGLSIGRNVGLKHASGKYIAFPDDDCEYPKDILGNVLKFFNQNDYDFLTCCSRWKDNKISNGNFDTIEGRVSKYNVWNQGISYTLFVKKEAINNLTFDENIGVGSKGIFQSGEETDFILKILKRNYSGFYLPSLFVFHPHLTQDHNDLKDRIKRYTPGKCYVLKKHRFNSIYIFLFILAPFLRFIKNLILLNSKGVDLELLKFKTRLFTFSKLYFKSDFNN